MNDKSMKYLIASNLEHTFTDTELASSAAQKTSWTLTASSTYDEANLELSFTADGNQAGTALDANIFSTKSPDSSEDKYPWIQVDLGELKVVKGVHMHR